MNTLQKPKILANTFCNDGNKTKSIPVSRTGTNACSLEEGFPVITSTAVAEGGIPPKRTDFNGVFFLLSTYCLFLQNGGKFEFDNEVSTAIGGYPQGAVLEYITGAGYHIRIKSLIDNNTNAPNDTNIKNPGKDPSGIYYWEDISSTFANVWTSGSLNTPQVNLKPIISSGIGNIKMSGGSQSGYGGHIDFNFNGQDDDHTSRIIEDEYRKLNLVCANGLKVNGIKQRNVVEKSSFSSAGNFYVIYDDGWVEQGGYIIGKSGGYSDLGINVIFQIPMANDNYFVSATAAPYDGQRGQTDVAMLSAYIRKRTNTGMSLHTGYQNGELPTFSASWCVRGWKA